MMRTCRTLVDFASMTALCCLCATADAAPQTGWWWNPSESGRGFFVESHDGITFIGAYLYDTDGHAMWLVAGGSNPDSYTYTGPLYSQSGGQTLFGTYVAPAAPASIGTLAVHFTDDTHGTVTWPGGTVAIERDYFGTGDAPFQPANGWWWNPDESGSGYSVEVQGNNMFLVGFMYEPSGRPVWYFSAGPMASSTSYHGDVLQFANGQTMSGTYRAPGAPTKIATLDLDFGADNEATATFTDLAGVVKTSSAKAGSSKSLKSQFDKPGRFAFPKGYAGTVHMKSDITSPGAHLNFSVSANANMPESFTAPGLFRQYAMQEQGFFFLHWSGTTAGGCIETGDDESLDLPLGSVEARVTSHWQYTVTLHLSAVLLKGTIVCPGLLGSLPVTAVWPGADVTFNHAVEDIDADGNYVYGAITNKYVRVPAPGVRNDFELAYYPLKP